MIEILNGLLNKIKKEYFKFMDNINFFFHIFIGIHCGRMELLKGFMFLFILCVKS